MNITYWLVVCLLLALAFLIIIPPLWKKREIHESDSEQRNVKIAQDGARDLKEQLQVGALTQKQFDEQYLELELSLGDDLDTEQHKKNIASQGRWIIPVIAICIPLFSVLTYFMLGEPDALIKAQQQQTQQSAIPSMQGVNAMVNGLAERLKQEPDNAKGWVMLGRSYKYLKQYKLAVDALEKAYALMGDEPELMLDYADALAMANQGKLSGKPAELIFKSLKKIPNSVSGLWLAGMTKVETGEFPQAIQYWRKLESLLPPGSKDLQEIQGMILAVLAQNPDIKSIEPEKTVTESKSSVSVDVQVSMSVAIKTKTNLSDTVFIYAKALTGHPMPIAIIRKQVSDLPISVTLDDSMAMMPTRKLSDFKQVKIMARISKSGTAMQQKGDFIGSFELQKLAGNTFVVIVINEEI